MKLEDILKQQGYSDQDLASISTLLEDQRFRSSLEAGVANLTTERDAFKGEAEKWQTWREREALPKIDEFARKAAEAQIESAKLREENRIAKEYGYLPKDQGEDPAVVQAREAAARAQGNPGGGQPIDTKNFLTRDDANQFAQLQGRAMAAFVNSAEEYRLLYNGKSLYEYQSEYGHGLEALLQEAQKANRPIGEYISSKFNFQQKRDEVSAAQKKASEDAIRADERARVAAEFGNPALRSPMPSRHALIPAKPKEGGMPWEHTSSELKERRVGNALKLQVQ